MKYTLRLMLVTSLFFLNIESFSQNFAPLGAHWYYQDFCWAPPWLEPCGYTEVIVNRDTVINGNYATILEKYEEGMLVSGSEVIIHEIDGQVFFWEESEFRLLYDFNLETGDTLFFQIPSNMQLYDHSCGGAPDTIITFQAIIDSVSWDDYSGVNLKTQYIKANYSEEIEGSWELGQVTERFGGKSGLFGYSVAQCLAGFWGFVKCYNDGIVGHQFTETACDGATPLDDDFTKSISVYPNPTSGSINIELGHYVKEFEVKLRNLIGQTMLVRTYKSTDKIQLPIETSPGIYLVEIKTSDGKTTVQKIIKE